MPGSRHHHRQPLRRAVAEQDLRQRGAGRVTVDVEPEGVDVDPEQAELLDPGAGDPLRRAAARRRERRRKRDAAVRFDERRRRHVTPRSPGRLWPDARRCTILPSRSNQNGAPRLIAATVRSQPTIMRTVMPGKGSG